MTQKKPVKKRTTDADQYIGAILRRTRIRRGLTQQALADSCGLTFQQIQKYERGTNRISATRLHQIAAFLDVPYTIFFEQNTGASPLPDLRKDHVRLLHHYDLLPTDLQPLFIQAMDILSAYELTRRGDGSG